MECWNDREQMIPKALTRRRLDGALIKWRNHNLAAWACYRRRWCQKNQGRFLLRVASEKKKRVRFDSEGSKDCNTGLYESQTQYFLVKGEEINDNCLTPSCWSSERGEEHRVHDLAFRSVGGCRWLCDVTSTCTAHSFGIMFTIAYGPAHQYLEMYNKMTLLSTIHFVLTSCNTEYITRASPHSLRIPCPKA